MARKRLTMQKLVVDTEFSKLIPALLDEERSGLEASLKAEGCRDALIVWNGMLIDGHNRYEICQKHNIEFQTTEISFDSRDDAKIWIIQNQFSRRNLNSYQRGKLALELKPLIANKAKKQQGTRVDISQNSGESLIPIDTQKKVAKAARVSHDTISKIEKIEKKATPKQKEQLEKGESSINHIHKQIRSQERRQERIQSLMDLSQKPTEELGSLGLFPVIYADPPWLYEHSKSDSRKIENQYPTMTLEDIKALEIPTTPDAILFVWATSPKLTEAIEVIQAWGFNYRTCMVWVKDRIGPGYYARQRHELLLIAKKGNMVTPKEANRPDSVIESPREKIHSKKPDIVYELIEQMYSELPKLEMFARSNDRENWSVWGNESA